jgi:hypothetical protein
MGGQVFLEKMTVPEMPGSTGGTASKPPSQATKKTTEIVTTYFVHIREKITKKSVEMQ